MQNILFVSGIDTEVGKTIATGVYAKNLMAQGFSVITQKMVQTGCDNISDDILVHRKIQGIELTEDDRNGNTCPYLFRYPCSPHLAAKMENRYIDADIIDEKTKLLAQRYDYVLLEGAGGLAVPYQADKTTLDFIAERQYPLILVTSGKLGSINHTLLSLMVCQQRNIEVKALIYNRFPEKDKFIEEDSQQYLQQYLQQYSPKTEFILLEKLNF
ncbi:dethiobiotin synthase [Gallibacterium anatis]|uniref:dethiobiotin synthase n=1 Tax=Gallibacterium anatis TaxID=750 RepID=UPI000530C32F|nr:dethiobiotin synthase [Gallibacterium anatis]KGQ27363.1 ATP-dependent dethiobiotin synthetase BioD [Gallibacterium anatis]KGQ27435.1 ATP-dependent dethiobiotin synthetase BioD [Gallibacterium anatis]KGQ27920.1 ATP-dependent dethiobiotin synthetase BioD [Gallibacterium anatis CCM5995]